ncbi:tigger transposable element-derived protein 1-like [Palaemon carinicauda]|uniref:tigger transposable element-derived protein 1-like n=1 Tax=Palaemon carinicauda TaxID=392227 RepID=UPI0035B5DEAA
MRSDIYDEMERLLLIWIKEKLLAGYNVTETIICEKVSGIYDDLEGTQAIESGDTSTAAETSKASRVIAKQGYIPQVFNCDESGVLWKNKPRKKFITAEEKSLLNHKPMKDRLTLALCANVSGYFKKYLSKECLPMKCLLVLDTTPGHLPCLEEEIFDEKRFIKVLHLPPNTTSLLTHIDQQIISNFKKLCTKYLFKKCFDVTENTNLTLREF